VAHTATPEGRGLQNTFQRPEHLFLLPIGGTATAGLAGLLKLAGHHVEGADAEIYPPMSTLLEDLAIPVRLGFSEEGPPRDVDRVIIGNALPRSNPEVQAVLRRRLPFLSQAEAVAHYLLSHGQHSLVVAGTHGKTTTSALLAWILESSGEDPSYLVGGLLQWSRRSFRLGRGRCFVIEGDEYNTAFFDRGPKFLHYRPHIFTLGPVEFDHGDIYRDLDAVLTAFRAGSAQVPRDGAVVVSGWSPNAIAAVRDTAARVVVVGPDDGCTARVSEMASGPDGASASVTWQGELLRLQLPIPGRHNLHNAALALATALEAGVPAQPALAALALFPGVARRLELVGEHAGISVVDDFAHHPTALAATISAARERWPDRRLVVAYEPRSLTACGALFQDGYASALAAADLVLVAPPHHRRRLPPAELLDRDRLARALEGRGVRALMPGEAADPVASLLPLLEPGDVVIGCSSGSFGDFHRRLLEGLGARS